LRVVVRLPLRRPKVVRTPTVLQMEAVECGAAALGIILGHHGRIVPLSELRSECGVSRDGSNAANVVKAARRYGLRAKGLSTDLEDVVKLSPPFIVFWNFNHFVVVEGFRRDRVLLNDPASGRRSIPFQEFDESFTGVVLYMEPGAEFERGGQEPRVARALATRIRGSARDLGFCIVAGLLLVAPGLAAPMLTQVFVDEILIQGRQDWLRPLLLGMALLAALRIVLRAMQLRYLRGLRTKLAIRLSGSFLWHVLRLPVGFFAQRYAGEVSSRLTLNHGIADVLSGQLAAAVIDCVMLAFYLALMLIYDVPLSVIGMAFALGNVLALRWIARRRKDANLRLRQEQGKVAGVSIAGLQSIETLKASALESSFFARWSGYYTKAVTAQQELGLTNQNLGVLPGLLSSLTTMLILVVGGWRVIEGELTIGMLVAFQSLMASFQGPVGTLVGLGGKLQTLQGDMTRVDDVLLHPVDPAASRVTPVEPPAPTNGDGRLMGRLEFRNVTFGYSRVAPPLIENLSFALEPGQRIALVGGSGSGKSTIAKLACGLYEPWGGEILLDGEPRLRIPREILAHSLALVDQDILFFAGSVRDNLTLWDDTVAPVQLEAACRDAWIHDVVVSLPGGYDAELLEGAANLSGGQRQRLEIARALVNNPSILVLDEATSALDAETEFRIDQNLRRRGCSALVVAHRLSTIRDAEEILVLSQGKVVQRGRHEDLWSAAGEYSRLVQSQA
jgi:ATP-binding cassette subfamily C protein